MTPEKPHSLPAIQLSDYGRASTVGSPVNRLMAQFASDFRDGVDINLGVGYVNEKTIPGELIHAALGEVLAQPTRYRQPLNYGGPAGSSNLIEAIRRFLIDQHVGGLTEAALADRQIIIGPNGGTSLLESAAHVLPRGIVVTADPVYYIYTNFLERFGYEVLAVPEDQHGIRTDILERKLAALGERSANISYFYVVTVGNPSCSILSNDRRLALIDIAGRLSRRLGRRIPVLFDRAYEDLVHDPSVEPPESGLRHDPLRIVYEVGTLSKVLAPALRIGYMIGSPGAFMQAMVQRTSDAGFSAPLMSQEIAARLLEAHIVGQLDRVRVGYREKSQATRAWLDEKLGGELESVVGGKAGFYLYLTFRRIETHEASPFFRYLTRTTGDVRIDGLPGDRHPRVIYIPGEHCVHSRGDLADVGRRQLRLSYGFEELDAIRRAIHLMGEAASYRP